MESTHRKRTFNRLQAEERGALQDKCGVVGIFAPRDSALSQTGLVGLQNLQTRGYDGAGCCAITSQGKVLTHKGEGMINEVFAIEVIKKLKSKKAKTWVFQTRYGTSGSYSSDNVQPFVARNVIDPAPFVLAHNGQFIQIMTDSVANKSDTAEFVDELKNSLFPTMEQRLIHAIPQKKGAWSLIIGTQNFLYLARDPLGVRPLWYGYKTDLKTKQRIWLAASETGALVEMGVENFLEVMPGSILRIDEDGAKLIFQQRAMGTATCVFETVYIQDGNSRAHYPRITPEEGNESFKVTEVRARCGSILAREAPLTKADVDLVVGVPGTGIPGGEAFAQELGLDYSQAITDINSPTEEKRTFMSAQIDSILQKVLTHFDFDVEMLRGKKVVLVDDSLVRGNVTTGLVRLLKEKYQVKAVHIRILCPPIDKTCHLGVNTRKQQELIVYQHQGDLEGVRAEIGADSLAYLSAEGLLEALTGNAQAKGFCMGCMLGKRYPIDRVGNIHLEQKNSVVVQS